MGERAQDIINEMKLTGKEAMEQIMDIKIEDEFKLPYGLGYDEIIQQKAD